MASFLLSFFICSNVKRLGNYIPKQFTCPQAQPSKLVILPGPESINLVDRSQRASHYTTRGGAATSYLMSIVHHCLLVRNTQFLCRNILAAPCRGCVIALLVKYVRGLRCVLCLKSNQYCTMYN